MPGHLDIYLRQAIELRVFLLSFRHLTVTANVFNKHTRKKVKSKQIIL